MQLPPRDSNGLRRLWPGSRWEEKAEAGAIVRVPSGIAVEAIRTALRNDAELHGVLIGRAPTRSTSGDGPDHLPAAQPRDQPFR